MDATEAVDVGGCGICVWCVADWSEHLSATNHACLTSSYTWRSHCGGKLGQMGHGKKTKSVGGREEGKLYPCTSSVCIKEESKDKL